MAAEGEEDQVFKVTQKICGVDTTVLLTKKNFEPMIKHDFDQYFQHTNYEMIPLEVEYQGKKITIALARTVNTIVVSALSFFQVVFADLQEGLQLYLDTDDKVWDFRLESSRRGGRAIRNEDKAKSRFVNPWDYLWREELEDEEIEAIEEFNRNEWVASIFQSFVDLQNFEIKIRRLNQEIGAFNTQMESVDSKIQSFETKIKKYEEQRQEKFPSIQVLDIPAIKRPRLLSS